MKPRFFLTRHDAIFNYYFSGEFYLGYSRPELLNASWYQLIHWDFMREAQSKHRLSKFLSKMTLFLKLISISIPFTVTQSEQDRSCILLIRLQRRNGSWLWIHCVLQVKEASETGQQPVIICTNQILRSEFQFTFFIKRRS